MVAGNVLVVEDDGLVRWALQKAAQASNVDVRLAASGAEALESIKGEHFDLAFLDIRLPDADGLDLLPRLRDEAPDMRVVVITADASQANRERAYSRGAWHFLEKPFELSEISRLITDCFFSVAGQRTHERRLCRFALRLELMEGNGDAPLQLAFEGSALDLSEGGLRLQTIYPLLPGQELRVHPVPPAEPGQPSLRRDAVARVVWTRKETHGITAGLAYVG